MSAHPVGFWYSASGKLLRWLCFLPVGFALEAVLYTIFPVVMTWAAGYHPDLNLLAIILIVAAVGAAGALLWFWAIAVGFVVILACAVIAPGHKAATIIFGAIYFAAMIGYLGFDWPALSLSAIVYQLLFSGLVTYGLVQSYRYDRT